MTCKHNFKVLCILATVMMAGLAGLAEAQQRAAAPATASTLSTFRKIFVSLAEIRAGASTWRVIAVPAAGPNR